MSAIVAEAAKAASERTQARGLPPLPHVTPHTLRRTEMLVRMENTNAVLSQRLLQIAAIEREQEIGAASDRQRADVVVIAIGSEPGGIDARW